MNFVLQNSNVFFQVFDDVEKGTEKLKIFKYLNDLTADNAEGSIPFFPYSENDKIDDFICYDRNIDDNHLENDISDTPDDVIVDKELGVTMNDAQIESSFKHNLIYKKILESAKFPVHTHYDFLVFLEQFILNCYFLNLIL